MLRSSVDLPGPAGADDHDHFAGLHVQADIIQRVDFAKPLMDVSYFDDRLSHQTFPRALNGHQCLSMLKRRSTATKKRVKNNVMMR